MKSKPGPLGQDIYSLSQELRDRLRVSVIKEKGKIINFVVQYEASIKSRWYAIIRYDTSHGFAHKDIIHYDGTREKQPLYFPNYNLAFTFAIQDLKSLWRWYRKGFEEEIEK